MKMQIALVLILASGVGLSRFAPAQESTQTRKAPAMTDDDVPVKRADPSPAIKPESPGKPAQGSPAPAGNFANVWTAAFESLRSQRSFRVSKVVNADRSHTKQAEFTLYPPDGVVGDNGHDTVITTGLTSYTVLDKSYYQTTIGSDENRCIRFFEDYPAPAEVRAVTRLASDGSGVYEGIIQRPYGPARVQLTISSSNKLTGTPGGMLVRIFEIPIGGGFPVTYYSLSEFNKDIFGPKSRIEDMKRDRIAR